MENIITINENGTHDFLASLVYGKTLVVFDSFNSEVRIKRAVVVINEILKKEAIRIAVEEEGTEGTVYGIIWTDKDNSPPTITEDEIDLPERALQASLEKSVVKLNINLKLKKYAKKIAENNGIRLGSCSDGMFFNGADKKPAIFPLMKQAYNDGKKFIEFDIKEVEVQTVRIYASQFNTFMGTKFSVSANNGKVRIQFAPPTPEEQAIESFNKIVNDLVLLGVLDEETAKDFVGFVESNDGSKYLANPVEYIEKVLEEDLIQPLLLKEDGQFKIPETKEEEEAIAGKIHKLEQETVEDDDDF